MNLRSLLTRKKAIRKPSQTAKKSPVAPSKVLDSVRTHLSYGTALAVLATLPILTTFAAAQLKSLFDSFTNGCQCVIEKDIVKNSMHITVRLVGTMPKKLPLTFVTKDTKFKHIFLLPPDEIDSATDMTAPPGAGMTCPGPLCKSIPKNDTGFDSLKFDLESPNADFVYRFVVRSLQPESPGLWSLQRFHVYAPFEPGLPNGVCRVELRQWHNFWIWGTTLQKALSFICMIVIGGLMLRFAKNVGEDR